MAVSSSLHTFMAVQWAMAAMVGGSPQSGTWQDMASTPPWLNGHCSTVWTSSTGVYELPYRVEFGAEGAYKWWAPFVQAERGSEVGVGAYLSPLVTITREDGSWETGYFGANRFTPDKTNTTNCCCEYVGQAGPGQPRVLADYCVAAVPGSWHQSMQEACAPHLQACPADNATALKTMGAPFIEIYSPCIPLAGAIPGTADDHLKVLVAIFAVLLVGLVLWWLFGSIQQKEGLEHKEVLSEPFLRSETEDVIKADMAICGARSQSTASTMSTVSAASSTASSGWSSAV
eukprot:TRINITY_DN18963_c0_g1_i1.p1 TRINITY_DN18963_c0_g1~~TRINITY_DN18963_c0_g1_i1.p1  ORF type:complete len:288 (+),score=44.96 TRINITY_DN18963_c0_g1_i1:74-937(+)